MAVNGKLKTNRRNRRGADTVSAAALAAALTFLAAYSGCNKHAPAPASPAGPPGPATLSEIVQRKISARVIGEIPREGTLREIRQRGILRVALPPEEPPFQSMSKLIKQPVGFNVALAGAIANVLEVKPNITILKQNEINGINDAGGSTQRYDIVFRTPATSVCAASRSLPYFYIADDKTWLTLCVSGDDDSLMEAVENTLAYFAETGIFTSLYSDYFK